MELLFGYWGKIVQVDLTRKEVVERKLSEGEAKKYIGGVGLAAKIILDGMPPHTDPLSPESRLVFAVGPFQATGIPGSGRWIVAAKSPLTGIWGEANGGGHWGPEFKRAGYDALVIYGRSEKPVYLWIHDGSVEIKDARDFWGMNVYETDSTIKKELGDPKIRVACIGRAGENLVKLACVISDVHGAAGRCGLGAVMGSKNLKAVAVRGEKEVPIAKPEELKEKIRECSRILVENFKEFTKHGEALNMVPRERLGNVPIKNWVLGEWKEGAEKIGAPTYTEVLHAKPLACESCPVACKRHIKVESDKYPAGPAGQYGPEYETLAMLGSNCLIDDLLAICKANELCNEYGIDTISTGSLIAFAMECYERGWITKDDTDGIELTWGNADAMIETVKKIGEKEGFGAVLGQGITYAAEWVGKGAKDIAVHVKGLDFPAHNPRAFFSWGLTFATSPRGACHVHGTSFAPALGAGLLPEVGIDKQVDRFTWKNKAYITMKYQDWASVCNSLVQCIKPLFGGVSLTAHTELLNMVTGWNLKPTELMEAGERIFNLQRVFNVLQGISRKDDTLPKRVFEPHKKGGAANRIPPLEPMLNEYYELRGWDSDGKPTAEKLAELGLTEALKPIYH
ncbi:aldehyde ferredoxin oxidoreductase family protein [Candidatus Bathyarchaeota archaeon]|nr:aldehyde ferredoxin oxidoreductase family protein [Candidatus Bathyarchaeota archaeon]